MEGGQRWASSAALLSCRALQSALPRGQRKLFASTARNWVSAPRSPDHPDAVQWPALLSSLLPPRSVPLLFQVALLPPSHPALVPGSGLIQLSGLSSAQASSLPLERLQLGPAQPPPGEFVLPPSTHILSSPGFSQIRTGWRFLAKYLQNHVQSPEHGAKPPSALASCHSPDPCCRFSYSSLP